MAPQRPEMTVEECEGQGATVVGDIGDGAIEEDNVIGGLLPVSLFQVAFHDRDGIHAEAGQNLTSFFCQTPVAFDGDDGAGQMGKHSRPITGAATDDQRQVLGFGFGRLNKPGGDQGLHEIPSAAERNGLVNISHALEFSRHEGFAGDRA